VFLCFAAQISKLKKVKITSMNSSKFKITLFLLLLFFGILFFTWSGLWGITLILLIIFDSLSIKLIPNFIKNKVPNWFYRISKYCYVFFTLLFFGVFCRVFFFEIYFIPSSSMERKLSEGDIIVVEKLTYGPILPKNLSEIPFLGLLFKSKKIENQCYKRLNGHGNILRNDIVVFKKEEQGRSYIKRIIGLPNETLKIIDSKVYIDNKLLEEKESFTFEYISKNQNQIKKNYLLSNFEHKNFDLRDSLKRNIYNSKSKVQSVFPKEKVFEWNRDNYGEIWIPEKGKSINLDKNIIPFYKNIIESESGLKIKTIKDTDDIFLGNEKINKYVFIHNYYFLLGDNRHFSNDSRFIGFIYKKNIIGKLF